MLDDCWEDAYNLIDQGKETEAMSLCQQTPCSESVNCQRFLGWFFYEQGKLDNALNWFTKAIEQEDVESLYGKACVCFDNQDFINALKYYEKASSNGYSRAYYWLGYLHEYGLGVDHDLEQASYYYRKGSKNGYLIADRAIIDLVFKGNNLLKKLLVLPKFIYILIKSFFIALENIHDERIVDIPNYFSKEK